jgi:hypothetical protein
MSGVLIIKPEPIAALAAASGSGLTNLTTPDPKEVWVAASASTQYIDIDFGAPVTVDSFCLAYTNARAAGTWFIQTGTGLGTGLATILEPSLMRSADSLGPRHHCFARLTTVTSRYFRVVINQGGTIPFYAGALVIGRAFEKHRERGPGRMLIDTGTRNDLPGGGFNMGDGVVKVQFAFSFVDLTDAENARLDAIKRDRGLRRPVLLVENADLAIGRNEAIHYGVFERFQAREDIDADVSRWAGSVIEWA